VVWEGAEAQSSALDPIKWCFRVLIGDFGGLSDFDSGYCALSGSNPFCGGELQNKIAFL